MTPDKEIEYAELDAFVKVWATDILGIDPDDPAHPSNVLGRMASQVSKTKALAGLRMASYEALESLQELTKGQIESIDFKLQCAGHLTLSELRRRHAEQVAAILERGRIRNDTEYYLAKSVLDSGSASLDPATQRLLASMLASYGYGG